jgi:hypothetical protein
VLLHIKPVIPEKQNLVIIPCGADNSHKRPKPTFPWNRGWRINFRMKFNNNETVLLPNQWSKK